MNILFNKHFEKKKSRLNLFKQSAQDDLTEVKFNIFFQVVFKKAPKLIKVIPSCRREP